MNKYTMSIDWEDFGQLMAKYHFSYSSPPLHNIIERQTKIILALFDKHDIKATFFILGMLAKYKPNLVREIQSLGHEIALHGNLHDNLKLISKQQAKNDIEDGYKIVTNITGKELYGYRAPYFSIVKENLHYLEILTDVGLVYDSSIFPIQLGRYGISNFPNTDVYLQLNNHKKIVELPITCSSLFGKNVPVAGGGYMRLFPKFLVNSLLNSQLKKHHNVMLYMHPYEFDTNYIDCKSNYPENAQYSSVKTAITNLRWNIFRKSIVDKLDDIFSNNNNNFSTCYEKAMLATSQKITSINDLNI